MRATIFGYCNMSSLMFALTALLSFVFGYVVIVPLLISAIVVNSFFRLVVTFLFRLQGRKYKLISEGVDNLYAVLNPNEDGPILAIMLAEYEPPEVETERKYFEKILSRTHLNGQEIYLKLKLIPTKKFGYACFKRDEKFSIENHVLTIPLHPDNGDCFTESEFFEKVVPHLSMNFEDLLKPKWEFVIVPKLMFEGTLRTARIFRFNHAYMDGVSAGIFMMENILNFEGLLSTSPYVKDPKENLSFSLSFQKNLINVLGALTLPYQMADHLLKRMREQERSRDPCMVLESLKALKRTYSVSKPIKASVLKNTKTFRNGTTGFLADNIRKSLVVHLNQRKIDLTNKHWTVGVPSAIFPRSDSPKNQVLFSSFSFPFESEIISSLRPGVASFSMLHFLNIFARFPVPVVEKIFCNGQGFTSTNLNSLPFTRMRGKLMGSGRQWVEDVGAYMHLYRGMGLAILVVRYNEMIRFWCVSDNDFMRKEELEGFLRILERQLESTPQSQA